MRYKLGLPLALCVSATAHAEDKWAIHPVQSGEESVRYVQGVPTLELELDDGVVRVTPLPMDHGRLSFTVAVYNDGTEPTNFGIADVAPSFDTKPVRVFTKDELVKQAKNRAFWSQFGLALLGATASSLAASQRNYYSHALVTPRGTYRSLYGVPSFAGQYQAAMLTDSTLAGIYLVQAQLDRTIFTLGDETVQLTTIDPGESYAGTFVMDKIRPRQLPAQVVVAVNWNGETYPFKFQVAKRGTQPLPFTKLTRRSNLTDFRNRFAVNLPPPSAATPTGQNATQPRSAAAISPSKFGNGSLQCETCRD